MNVVNTHVPNTKDNGMENLSLKIRAKIYSLF